MCPMFNLQINKPELPVASGEISNRLAWGLVLSSLTAGPLIVANCFSPLIFRLYAFGLLVGGLYSVPPFKFKRFPVVAGLTIACVRGFLLNFGVYYAVREALGLSFRWNPAVLFLARFMTVFAGIIAVTKVTTVVLGCCPACSVFGLRWYGSGLRCTEWYLVRNGQWRWGPRIGKP